MTAVATFDPPTADAPDTAPILLESIQLSNLLSFGPDTPELPLRSLNVLIGANGSGKSNLIDAIALLRSTPDTMLRPTPSGMIKVIQDGGGVQEWIYKGNPEHIASIQVNVQGASSEQHLNHLLAFGNYGQRFVLVNEAIANRSAPEQNGSLIYSSPKDDTDFDFASELRTGNGRVVSAERGSVLSRIRDEVNHPEITYLADQYELIRIYREWQFGRKAKVREYVDSSMPQAILAEDFSNLALVLNRLCRDPKIKKTIVKYLHDLYDGVTDIGFDVLGGFIQLYLIEGEQTIPVKRLSDGTLHYLCLLAILCDPNPPPLICIEEPELGLHFDAALKIADLMIEASARTQLIVTTHSTMIVSAMTDTYESVLVCEKHNGQTEIERLEPRYIEKWLDKYGLGELWISGELGGGRW